MAELSGFTTRLAIYITNAFVDVAQVRDINPPATALDTVEVSHRDSAWKKYLPSLIDAGEATFDIVYDPDLQTHKAGAAGGLAYAAINKTREQFRVTFGDAAPAVTAIFYGYVTKFTPKSPYAGALTADVTIRPDGAVTWA